MLERAKQSILNRLDIKIKRKILVFQSDDWGSIRMPSKGIRDALNKNSYIDATDSYTRYDTLASDIDLNELFEVLSSFQDQNGNHVKITANCVVANPDFEKIKEDQFQRYHFESLKHTFSRYNNSRALDLWQEGYKNGLFVPQFHGREHVNVPHWLFELRNNHKGVIQAFDNYVFGVNFRGLIANQVNLQPAWDIIISEESSLIDQAIIEGLKIFENMFGYRSITATPPNYTWTRGQESILKSCGVESIQGILKNRLRNERTREHEHSIRFTSFKKDTSFQRRNIFFEPSLQINSQRNKVVGSMLRRLDFAFKSGRAAIIGSHRLNFVGVHDESNRRDNLKLLKEFLKGAVRNHPEIEFMSADEYHDVLASQKVF